MSLLHDDLQRKFLNLSVGCLYASDHPEISGLWRAVENTKVDPLELRNTIIALLMTDEFANLPSNSLVQFPEPEEVDDDYRFSRDCPGLPARDAAKYGKVADVLHQQADIVMDLVFEQLRVKSRITRKEPLTMTFKYLPHPKTSGRSFRLTRDWELWPSLGVIDSQVTNATQARLALMADVAYETLKVLCTSSRKVVKIAKAIGSGTDVEEHIFDDVAIGDVLLAYEDSLIAAVEAFANNANKQDKLVLRRGSKGARPIAIRWREESFEEDVANALHELSDADIEELFVRLCKQYNNAQKSKDKSNDNNNSKGKGKGKTNNKGKVNPKDKSSMKSSKKSSKNANDESEDQEEEEEEEEEEDEGGVPIAPTSVVSKRRYARNRKVVSDSDTATSEDNNAADVHPESSTAIANTFTNKDEDAMGNDESSGDDVSFEHEAGSTTRKRNRDDEPSDDEDAPGKKHATLIRSKGKRGGIDDTDDL